MLATALTAIAAAYLTVALLSLAPHKLGYSHIKHTISEIGEIGSRHERFVAFGVFLPVGLLLLAVAYLARSPTPAAGALALCISVGYIGAALFPCDPGSPLTGSSRQGVHNLAGAVEYVGGGFALMIIGQDFGQPFELAAFIVLVAAVGLSILPPAAGRGLLQRIAEACLFGCLGLAAWPLATAA